MIYKCKLESCGKDFRGRPSADRKYCSNQCRAKARSLNPPNGKRSVQAKRYRDYAVGAQSRGKVFNLSLEEFVSFWQVPCHYCGGAIKTIGLDRVDNTRGYVLENVVPCCSICNTMKMGLTLDEFFRHFETIRRHTGRPLNVIDKTAVLGERSVVWHFATILSDVRIGKDCSIGSYAEVGRGSIIGDGCRISNGVFLPSNSILEKRVFIGPRSTFCDDRVPRVGNKNYVAEPPYLETGCSVGAGCTVLPGVRIGTGALIGAGSVVTRDVPPHEHVRGEPARVKPYSRIKTETNFDIYAPSLRPETR